MRKHSPNEITGQNSRGEMEISNLPDRAQMMVIKMLNKLILQEANFVYEMEQKLPNSKFWVSLSFSLRRG